MKTKELVYYNNIGDAVTTSLIVAEVLDIKHEDLFNEVKSFIEVIRDVPEVEGETAEDDELWMFFRKKTFTNSQGKKQDIYEITKEGIAMLALSFKEKEDLQKEDLLIEVLLKEFIELVHPIFRGAYKFLKKKEIEDVLRMLDLNSPEAIVFKKGLVSELNKRAVILDVFQTEISELRKKLEFYNAKTILDYAN